MKKFKNSVKLECIIIFLLLFSPFMQLNAQEERTINDFNKISFNISGDLYIEQSDEYSLKLEGETNDLEKITTQVEGKLLIIKTKNHSKLSGNIKVYITLPILNAIDLAGSGDVIANNTIKTESIKVSVTGSGDVQFKDLQTTNTQLGIAGSGSIMAKGNSKENLKISITGSGDIKAFDFGSNNVEIEISGSGSAQVFAKEKLNTAIVGSGSVLYKGNPLIDANSVGSGKTRKAD